MITTLSRGARSGWRENRILRRFLRNKLGLLGLTLVLVFILVALLAPVIAPVPPNSYGSSFGIPNRMAQDGFSPIPQPPSSQHPLGLAQDGYDILFGLVWGTRTAFIVSGIVVTISLVVGALVGTLAGFYRGWIDTLLMRFTDVVYAFPDLILLITLVVALGRNVTSLIIATALLGWAGYARLIRGEILKVRELEYVDAARSLGANNRRLILRHVLPNSLTSLLAQVSLNIGTVVLSFATLSFLGLGVPNGFPDWGQLINLSRNWVTEGQQWYTYVYPGVTILLFGVAWNLLSDALREAADPRGQS
ncbi:ABC transporter permease (plasmid) [Deinococcus metallilatus]|uniref:ABC transporter permease n=1 Tax=Deinococcus metallilatus TaxID=1211322 RepID=A0AAJ5JZN2_9DEIO|nr:ABC transporter permease [Deinococcus metallilatus]MBB5293525.1 peptide/nickel transport system permease protein [Deinococcus metallilatus]QBY06601.1 ABC transporter permease [Deinococcus metallilatus]RXJ17944.1 ABC transporter permease [Deinococcus metallilatus]TLK32215.1 ABC transporter permease [Deinococcus metallilatus]GMA15255.1 peptide ABC transporter permease [Deinococcus metallilatus]